jgi:hypothetical protein
MSPARVGLVLAASAVAGCAETASVCEARLTPINPPVASELLPPSKDHQP